MLLSKIWDLDLKGKVLKLKYKKPKLFVLRTVGMRYAIEIDWFKHCSTNRSSGNDDTFFGYVAKLVKKVWLQMKAHLINPKDLISVIGFFGII